MCNNIPITIIKYILSSSNLFLIITLPLYHKIRFVKIIICLTYVFDNFLLCILLSRIYYTLRSISWTSSWIGNHLSYFIFIIINEYYMFLFKTRYRFTGYKSQWITLFYRFIDLIYFIEFMSNEFFMFQRNIIIFIL